MIFDFESDFAGSLRCIPMIVRQKLDIVGIKLSLRQWSRFTRDERGRLTELSCESSDAQAAYRALVLRLVELRSDEPAVWLVTKNLGDWQDANWMPEPVKVQAAAVGVPPPTQQQWAELTALQRFALVKLARSKHENENFLPAMKEFGIL
ncbi:nitrate reductase associated protein [Gluconacetobacter sp. Hr-1-5]|uniref:nitrate reductase associated protein n=1 Tax=Gluconacetobacter sp. Hr-1-5 TaxID=3395370 RepID=UPI003B52A4FD